MATQRLNFTAKALEKIQPPTNPNSKAGGIYDVYRDTRERGLTLMVSNGGAKTFYYYGKINGKPERIKLGKFPDMSIEKARTAAARERGKAGEGKNTNEERRKLRAETTLGQFFGEYMERYSKKHKKSWRYDEREIPQRVGDWFKKRLGDITRQHIQKRMEKIHDTSGPYAANHFLQRMRALYNKAIEWGWEGSNPAEGIKQYKKTSRDRFLQPDEMPHFFKALAEEPNRTAGDYILLSLLTGARKMNVLQMRWEQINWERKEWRIPETKNGEPLTLPLSDMALEVLRRRQTSSLSPWVFADAKNGEHHYADPKKPWNRILMRGTLAAWEADPRLKPLVEEARNNIEPHKSKHAPKNLPVTPERIYKTVQKLAAKQKINLPVGLMDVRLHDLRRTLGSYQAANGANSYIIGKSLGHKSQQSTAIYARLNLDPVRQAVTQANEVMLSYAMPKS